MGRRPADGGADGGLFRETPSSGRVMAVGGLLGLGSLVRSHLLPVAFAWPVWVLWREREARWRAGLAAAGSALALAAFGFGTLRSPASFA